MNQEHEQLICSGNWDLQGIHRVADSIVPSALPQASAWWLNTTAVRRMDSAGAWLIYRILSIARASGATVHLDAVPQRHRTLLQLVAQAAPEARQIKARPLNRIEKLGKLTLDLLSSAFGFLSFMGMFAVEGIPRVLRPWQLRWKQISGELRQAGVAALPIVGLLSFLMGVVIAYQGGIPLDQYGANVFLVELVGITMLREMGPLLTAIVVAGRTGSAYAAQIGTMRITEEVDALRSLGIPPFEVLALPKLLALIIALPLLTVWADILGLLGGAVVADRFFGVTATTFVNRLPDQLPTSTFWVGVVKAPIFAAIITLVGCYHGFRVEGGAESVGRATTISVVQSIFWVIAADAVFSILFQLADL